MPTSTKTSPEPATSSPPPAAAVPFELAVTNGSTVAGRQCFNIFPPPLNKPSQNQQTITALVSDPMGQGDTKPLTWNGGSGALALFAFVKGASLDAAERTPVALGDTVAVAWADGAFTVTPAAGGPAGAIEATFAGGVPPGSQIGLVVGPAPILVPVPAGLSSLTLEPDLSQTVTVVFGTAFQFPEPDEWDRSQAATVTFKQDAAATSPTAVAKIVANLDNKIVQTG